MSKPVVKELVGGYEFSWGSEKLVIKVSSLRVHASDGRVTGDISLIDSQSSLPLFPKTSFNFKSEPTRSRLIKSLEEQDKDSDPRRGWAGIINQLCVLVVALAQEGEPLLELWTHEEAPPPEWLLEPLLYRGLPTIVFGEKTTCKSLLALVAYACLTLGWQDNPFGWKAPARSIPTLLLDYEGDSDVAQWNLKRIQTGMELPHFPLNYRRCALPLADDVEQISRHMAGKKIEALIIDSLGPAVGGDLLKPTDALRFTSALRQLKCGALVIGQTSKERKGTKSVFGSVYFEYYARHIIELRKATAEFEEDTLSLALYNTYNNLGKHFKPRGLEIHFNETGIQIESQPITAPELIERLGTQLRIAHLLRRGPLTTQKIAKELSLTEDNVRTACHRLKKKSSILKIEDAWGLAAAPEPD